MITSQFRLLLKVKTLGTKINNSFAIAQALKIHNFVASKALATSKLYTMEELKNTYQSLINIDEKLKTSAAEEKILFTQMINSL